MDFATYQSRLPADRAPLAWVIDQVRDNLLAALAALRQQADAGGDPATLARAGHLIHQAAGAIELLGHAGAARVLQAAERAATRGTDIGATLDTKARSAIEAGLHAALDYLDALLSGKDEPALKLFQQYRALAEAAGGEPAHPADLWDHDTIWPRPPRDAGAAPLVAADRVAYERALLDILRGRDVPRAAAAMKAVAARARAATADNDAARWWMAEGVFEAHGSSLVARDLFSKRLCSRLNLQLKALVTGLSQPAQKLGHELLFFCDRASAESHARAASTPVLDAIAEAAGLAQHPPVDFDQIYFGRVDPAQVQLVRRRVVQVKDGWSQLANEDFSRVDRVLDACQQLARALRAIAPGAEALAIAVEHVVRAVSARRELLTPERVLEVATALLFLEASFAHFRADDASFLPHAHELAQRLERSAVGSDAGTFAPWMEELYRRTSEGQTMGTVVEELHHDMATVEELLDAYFRDPATHEGLATVPRLLNQMRGVLGVLGMDTGAKALGHIRESVEQLMLAPPDEQAARAPGGVFDQLAANMGALGFLVDMLAYQPDLAKSLFTYDADKGELRPIVGSTPRTAPPRARPDAVPAVATDERDVEPPDTGSSGTAPAPDVAAKPTAVAVPDAVDVDPELLEIFLDEATDVISAGRAVLSFLKDDEEIDDDAALTSVRRAFHTLKGSARMVGLNDFGEAAWELEQLFNQVLAKQRRATLPVLDLARRAFVELGVWTEALRAGGADGHSSASLAAAARGLRGVASPTASGGMPAADEPKTPLQATVPPLSGTPQPALPGDDDLLDALLPPMAREATGLVAVDPAPAPVAAGATLGVEVPPEVPDTRVGLPPAPMASEAFEEPRVPRAAVIEDDAYRTIGDLHIPTPLYNIYLSEADELVRRLAAEVAAIAARPSEPATPDAAALAHQLRGSSRTVGFRQVGDIANLLEDVLQLQREVPIAFGADDATLIQQAVEDIHRMLHQFAGGALREPMPQLTPALESLIERLQHAQAAGAPPVPFEQGVALSSLDSVTLAMPEAVTTPPVADSIDPDLFPVFEFEAAELLPQLAAVLRGWEAVPSDRAAPKQAMRLLHTFKGSARMAGAMALGEQAHQLESDIEAQLLGAELIPDASALTELVTRHDALALRFERLREAGARGQSELGELRVEHALHSQAIAAAQPADSRAPAAAPPDDDGDEFIALEWPEAATSSEAEPAPDSLLQPPAPPAPLGAPAPQPAPLRRPASSPRATAQPVRVRAALLDRLVNQVGEISIARARLDNEFGQIRNGTRDLGDNLERLRSQVRDIELQADAQMAARTQAARDDVRDFDPLEFDRFTRFQELTRMMAESVNDLALVQGTLSRALQSAEDNLARQARMTRELQRDLLRTRMVEFDSISERLYRTVRQAGKDAGKAVRLDIEGGTIEIDRGVLDRMAPTFEHLLRNAVAHGLEEAGTRALAGKAALGTVTLRVHQEGSEVVVSVSDDGAGLNDAAIEAKARAMGLLGPDEHPTQQQLHALIFRPGFTSLSQASEIAGRGVGLDVVRTDTRALGGRIELRSMAGVGTTFTLVLPLTTAVTQVALLRVGTRIYGVPSSLVDRVLRMRPADAAAAARPHQQAHGGGMGPV